MFGSLHAIGRMAARNVLRNRRRTWLSASAIALCVAFTWISTALTLGMLDRTLDNATSGLLGHAQIHHADYGDDPRLGLTIPQSLVDVVAVADPRVRAVAPRLYGEGYARRDHGAVGSGIMLVGVDPMREMSASGFGDKIEGLGALPFDTAGNDGAVLGDDLAHRLEVGLGDALTLTVATHDGRTSEATVTVAGVISTGLVELDDAAVFVPLSRAQALTGLFDRVHEIAIRGDDAAQADALVATLAPIVTKVAPHATVESWRDLAPDMALWADVAGGTFLVFAFVIVLVVGAAILLTQSMIVFERRRELGLLRAIGLRPRQLLALLVIESSTLAVLGTLLGLALGGAALLVLDRTGLDLGGGAEMEMAGMAISPILFPRIDALVPLETFATTVLLAAVASLLAGARTAMRGPVGVMHDA